MIRIELLECDAMIFLEAHCSQVNDVLPDLCRISENEFRSDSMQEFGDIGFLIQNRGGNADCSPGRGFPIGDSSLYFNRFKDNRLLELHQKGPRRADIIHQRAFELIGVHGKPDDAGPPVGDGCMRFIEQFKCRKRNVLSVFRNVR